MIADLKNSKNPAMQENVGESDAATVPATIKLEGKEQQTSALGATGATTAPYRQLQSVTETEKGESSCGVSESSPTKYKRKLMLAFSLGDDREDPGGGGVSGAGSSRGILETFQKDNGTAIETMQPETKKSKISSEKEQMFDLFQPWALKTYGDQAKTKTITLRKKARILKALEGKEHSRPDSSKFRFWVKSKAFTTKKPEGFQDIPDYPTSSNLEYPSNIDLYVASTTKDFGHRTYRKVAVVEEFFNIIYNIHVEMGGRSGRHAGQKRTYRIISETYAFLPREAVTRFLSACPECKKNLRPISPGRSATDEEQPTESPPEADAQSLLESSTEVARPSRTPESIPTLGPTSKQSDPLTPIPDKPTSSMSYPMFPHPSLLQKIHLPTTFRPPSHDPELVGSPAPGSSTSGEMLPQIQLGMLSRESLYRYYEFMRRVYSQPSTSAGPSYSSASPRREQAGAEIPGQPFPAGPQREAIDLTIEDEPSTSAAAAAVRSESVQEASQQFQQVRAINLSKLLSSEHREEQQQIEVTLEHPREPEPEQQAEGAEPGTQLDLRKVKPITSTYLQLTRSMGLSDADALKLDDLVSKDFKYTL